MYTLPHLKEKGELTESVLTRQYKEICENFRSHEEYHSYNVRINADKIKRAEAIIDFCKKKNVKKILSIGSGGSITEIEIKNKLPHIEMICTDFVPYICDKLSELYKNIQFRVFDMRTDDPSILGNNFDMVLFCGSDYVMTNDEYIKILKDFNKMGIKYVYIVTSPYINILEKINQICINGLRIIGILINYTSLNDGRLANALRGRKIGLFHGYLRDFKELKMIFNEAGYEMIQRQYTGITGLSAFPVLTARNVNILLELKLNLIKHIN